VSALATTPMRSLLDAGYKAKPPATDADVWCLNLDQIESHSGKVLSKQKVKALDVGPSTYSFEKGTVLYCKLRPYLNKVVVADEDGMATTELVTLRCDRLKVLPDYLAHFLRSSSFLAFATNVVAGAKMPRMVMGEFWAYPVPLPPLEEQRRIAAILDQAETLRTQRRQALAHLDTLTQSLFLDMFGDPARNTLGLPMQALGDLGDWHSGGTPPRGSGHYFEGDIPWFSSGELESMYVSDSSEHISESAVRETSAKHVPAGALMLGMYDTAALKSSIAMNACSCNQAIAFASIRPDCALTEYVYFAVQVGREDFRRLQRGVRQKNLNLSMVREIRIPAPTLALQQTFATRIAAIEALKATHRAALAQLDALFASLQQRAFAGEL
jgi:type I restriction enzyme, S subunit